MSERAVTSEGLGLHCEITGTGDAVLIALHGGPGGDGAGYLGSLHRLGGLARTVVSFDQLGTGRSDTPPADYAWSVTGAVADVDAVRRHVGVERVDVFGHSWGGMLALQYTLDHPDRVRRLVLSNTAPSSAWITASFVRQLLGILQPRELAAALTADAVGDHDDPAFRSAVSRWLAAFDTAGDEAAAHEATREALDPGPAGIGLWGDRLWFATTALRGWDAEDRLGEITAPTLMIHGGRDMSGADINRVLAEGIPDAEWLTLQHNGHGAFDAPNADTYLAVVESFLDGWPLRKGDSQP